MNEIKEFFDKMFSRWEIKIPQNNLDGRIDGFITEYGWIIQYCFGVEKGLEYMDFYATHNLATDRHTRIYEDGSIEYLPTFQICHGIEEGSSEEKAMIKYNQELEEILNKKGFNRSVFDMLGIEN
jgi:predicted alpha/beta-fold hydrolase